MSGSYRNFRLVLANLLLPVATLVFAAGFFRYKPSVPVPDLEPSSFEHFSGQAPFDKVVFLVVDALRR
jgi:ethanolaminephosphotransferase